MSGKIRFCLARVIVIDTSGDLNEDRKWHFACLKVSYFYIFVSRGVVFELRVELKHFNKDVFLKKQTEIDKKFYTRVCIVSLLHYGNTPIQIYRKFYHRKTEIFR